MTFFGGALTDGVHTSYIKIIPIPFRSWVRRLYSSMPGTTSHLLLESTWILIPSLLYLANRLKIWQPWERTKKVISKAIAFSCFAAVMHLNRGFLFLSHVGIEDMGLWASVCLRKF